MSRRSVRRKNYDHRAFKLAVLVILMGLITYMAYFWVFRISPNLEAVSAIKTKSIVNRIVNETINEKFGNETSAGNLLITETDEEAA